MARKSRLVAFALGVPLAICQAGCTPGSSANVASPVASNEMSFVSSTAPRLLTYPTRAGQVYQATGMQGSLVVEDGCIFLRTPSKRFLAYFPAGLTRWNTERSELLLNDAPVPMGVALDIMGSTFSGKMDTLDASDPQDCDARDVFFVTPAAIRRL